MVVLVSYALLLVPGTAASATCSVRVETVDEQGRPVPAVKVWLESESCRYRSESRLTDEQGAWREATVPGDCRFLVHGEIQDRVIPPVAGTCGGSDRPIRLVCIVPLHVSLIRILANPEVFDGRYVAVTGVLLGEVEGDALYVDEASLKRRVTMSAIALDLRPDQWLGMQRQAGQSVTLTGRFRVRSPGRMSTYAGRLDDIQ
jgi:hypothetical protein